jgi:uncharacterized protein YggE
MLRLKPAFLIAALAGLLVAAPAAAPAAVTADSPSVSATGTGYAEAAPDIAVLRFGVTSRQQTVAAARDEVAAGVGRLLELARSFGIADEHISTAALNVRPDTAWNPETRTQEHRGFIVSRQLSFKLTDISRLGELTERALGLGVTEASPAVFDTSRRAELEAEALAAAARDARARATTIATALGARVGKPLSLSAVGVVGPPQPMLRAAMAEADGMGGAETYEPGLIRVEAGVNATFELGD